MLGKLLKQEFGATARSFIPLYGFILVLTPLFGLMTRVMIESGTDSVTGMSFLGSLAILGIFGFSFIIVAAFIATLILVVIRFYKTTATSEAYLTFTLPVKTWQIVLSKTAAAVVWEVLAAIIAVASIIFMFIISGFVDLNDMIGSIEETFDLLFYNLDGNRILTMFLFLMAAFTGVIASIMKVYTAIAIGQLFRNHRVLISIGMYFAIQFALQFISIFISITMLLSLSDTYTYSIYQNISYTITIVQNIAVSVAGFWVTTWIMKKHLNVM